MAVESRGEYYDAWGKYATKADLEEDEEEAAAKAAAAAAALRDESARYRPQGYEFRRGHRTKFPDCAAQPGESDVEAAFRVAGERRAAGVASFGEGSVWGAQEAVDAWGQGLLALERFKNLRRHKVLEAVSHEGEEGQAESEEALTGGPSDEEVAGMVVGMRLNIAQALLKLREFENCVVHCEKALEIDPSSTKGLWRKAKAIWGMRNPGLAREALGRLLDLEPGNAAAIAMLREIDQEEAKKRVRRTGVKGVAPRAKPARPPNAEAEAEEEDEEESESDGEVSVVEFVLSHCRCCRRREKAD